MTRKIIHKQTQFRLKPACAALLLAFAVQTAQANPIGAAVVNGQASFATSGNTLTVTNTPGAIINWQGFSIGANEITRFAQQSASSSVLNRVISNNPSSILGSLQSNGRVFLVNPNGIVFGQGATINVAGMVASTLNLSNADFLAGRNNFTQVPGAQNISNAGNLTAHGDGLGGGQIYLIAPNVENTGIINAPNGEILLAAGHSVELVNSNEPNLRVNITAPAGDATNVGKLVAEAGSLGLFGTVVRNSGTVSADSATLQGGKIVFKSSQRTEIGGIVSANSTAFPSPASAGEGNGGTIQALGNQVGIMDGATVTADGTQGGGTILVGGDYQGNNPNIPNAQVTYVAPTATIRADATQNGDGGKVVVWADDTTRAYGNISARGGVNGGNGGFVEISGYRHLDFQGRVDTQAPQGKAGTLLLDPADITIDNSADFLNGGTLAGGIFSGATGNSTLTWATINAQTGSLEIRTNSAGAGSISGNGDIFVNANGTVTGPTTLTLLANGDINIANGVAVSGSGNFNLVAGWNNIGLSTTTGAGNIIFGPASSLSTPGNILLHAGNSVSQDPSAAITANTLNIIGSQGGARLPGGASLPGTNMVNTLAVDIAGGGSLTFSNGQALTIGTVGGFNGILASGNANPVIITTIAGGITVGQNISSGGSVTLDAVAGGIAGTGQIIANTIALQSSGGTGNIGTSLLAPLITSSIGGAGNANISIGNATGPGAIYLSHIGDATLSQVFTTGAGTPVNISATNNLTATSINSGAAQLNLKAGNTLTIPGLTNLASSSAIALSGDLINIQTIANAATINAGAGSVFISNSSASRNIDLGAKAALPATLELSTNELNTITAGLLKVGTLGTGNINISAAIAPANVTALSLYTSAGGVTQAAAGTITASQLAVRAGANVVLDTVSNSVTNLAAQVSGGASNFSFKNAGALNVANGIDGAIGISTPGMAALISAGPLTQSAGAMLNSTSAYLEGSSVTLNNANPVGVIAGRATGAANGDIFSYTSSNGIMVTTVNGFPGIQTGSPPNAVSVVLNAGSAGISQDQPIFAGPAGTNGLSLITTGPVNLGLIGNEVSFLTAVGVGQLAFDSFGALTVGDGTNGVTTTANGAISIGASGNLTVQNPVNAGTGAVNLSGANIYLGSAAATTVTGGAVSLTATSNSGTVSQFAGGMVSATQNGLSIIADNISLLGTVKGANIQGIGLVNIQPFSVGWNIDIAGAAATAGTTLSITQANLAAINPAGSGIIGGSILFGSANSGAITFKGNFSDLSGMFTNLYGASVSQAPGTVISGSLNTQVSGAVMLTNPANQINVFTTMSASANVATNVPSLTLFSSVNAGAGGLSITNSGGNIQVNSTTAASTINLQGANGITLGAASSLTASGVATIVLNAGAGSFINNSSAGAAALSAPSSRWLVYAASPASVVKGGLISDFRQYNTAYGGNINSPTGNGFIYASTPGVLNVDTTLVSGTASHIYGATPTAVFGYTFSNPTVADNEDLSLIASAPIFTPALSSLTPVGPYSVKYLSGLTSAAGYTFTPGVGLAYTVNPALLTLITASLTGTAGKTYDGTNAAKLAPGNFSLSGFVGTDSATVTKTTGTYASPNVGSGILVSTTLAAADFSPVGSTNLANYTLPTSASGNIGKITPASLSVTANSQSKVYGSADPALTYVASGLLSNDTLTGSLARATGENVGTYAISKGTLNNPNYTINYTGNDLSITQAALTVAANNASKVYDATPYSGGNGVTYSGLTNGDTAAALGGTLTYSGTSQGAVNTGNYIITPGGLTSSNYTISYVDGTLTISPAALGLSSVTAHNASKTYGTTLTFAGTEFTPVGLLGGDTISSVTLTSPGAVDTANAGTYPITPSNAVFSVGNSSNYTISYVDGLLTVNPALLTVTANALSKTVGSMDPLLTYMVAGLKLADTEASTLTGALARLAGESVGTYQINQGSLTLLSANYTMNYVPADFSILASITPRIVDTLVKNTVVTPPEVEFTPPAPPLLRQTQSDDASADADSEKKDNQDVAVAQNVPAAAPAPAAAPLPVCK